MKANRTNTLLTTSVVRLFECCHDKISVGLEHREPDVIGGGGVCRHPGRPVRNCHEYICQEGRTAGRCQPMLTVAAVLLRLKTER